MNIYQGTSISKGIAIGTIIVYEKGGYKVAKKDILHVNDEVNRYEEAKKQTSYQLSQLYQKALNEVGEMDATIFDAHAKMLEDKTYTDSVIEIITSEKVNAEYAVSMTCDKLMKMFYELDDEYFKARAADIKDISERLIRELLGRQTEFGLQNHSSILLAEDLSPSETVQMDKSKILAFVTTKGTLNSHASILARSMNIPAISGISIQKEWNGMIAIVDGNSGDFIVDPDDKTLEYMQMKQKEELISTQQFQSLIGKDDVTLDGKRVRLYANIGHENEVDHVLRQDASGIGLFRSEFIYLEKETFPTEEELFLAYKEVAQKMKDKPVIIRTLDIGADKKADYFHIEKEDNPALGYRAIRICLDRVDIFKTQLRAILRASYYGNISILYPMIISLEELHKIHLIFKEVKEELAAESIPYCDIKKGIMIETPAAVLISDLLAKEVDFFSIGTNDLTQYTLAIDRQNSKLSAMYDEKHEAIFRMIQMVIENGHKENCWVGICGELAADENITERLLKMGIDEFSVAPAFVLPIRNRIRKFSIT